jgi:Mg2+ transporter MgtE
MLGSRIMSDDGDKLGRLEDVVAVSGPKFPVVTGVMVGQRQGTSRRHFYVPWSMVEESQPRKLVVRWRGETGDEPSKGDIFLSRDLLDKQIVDMDGYKIVRVSDIRIAESGGELRVMGADVGMQAILRRLGLRFLARAMELGGGIITDRVVPWNLVSPVGPMPYDVRLKVPYRKFMEIHPSDVADIIEQLDVEQRAKVLALIEDPKAAEVLARMIPGVRSSVAQAMEDERLSDLLEIMPPDEAADVLGALPRDKAQVLLSLMGLEEARIIRELLGYDPDTAGGRMTTEFVAVRDSLTAEETIEHLRRIGEEAETIYYVYVVDSDGHLSGVLSLRDLLRAKPPETVGHLMMRDVVTAEVDDDQERAAEKLSRYNLLALPVVDEDNTLKGIVTVDDAIDVMIEETSEDFSQLSGVPLAEEGRARRVRDMRRWAGTLLTFLGGILATALFGIFKSVFVAAIAVVYFVPLALRASHDVSVWSVAASVRELKEREEGNGSSAGVVAREYLYTLAAAAVISLLGFSAGLIWTRNVNQALAGGVGLFVGVAIAGMLGLLVPEVMKRARPEPSVAPGRLAGVIVMAMSMVAFLGITGLFLKVF